ncbi:radical SAM protein [Victivallis sp. Marseille-Q1083]|uniref:radical SAM protein n=1 Tax=Victivallis sp. Marseille-Q1083 TaxID=2717288 RepID=UPI0015897FA8|nr:radical SAM protein [Victivallis sp. Marseille-Q1083]
MRPEPQQSDRFQVVEAFLSLQGESTHAGKLCYFIRLAGCNLRCSYCDTAYAQSAAAGAPRRLAELLDQVRQSGAPLVEITGGEPLEHPNLPLLCQALLTAGLEVLLETNGSRSIAAVPAAVRKIVDCKLPSSGMSAANCFDNFRHLQPHDEVKFVIGDRTDYQYARRVIDEYHLTDSTSHLLFSPVWGSVEPAELAGWIIEDKLPVRLQIQLHKLIWGPDKTGV